MSLVPDVATTSRRSAGPASTLLAYATVCVALGNAVLRPAVDVPVTPYYLAAPVAAMALAASVLWFRNWLAVFGAVACYGLLVGIAYGVPIGAQASQLLKYLQLLTLFGLLRWLHEVDPEAGPTLRRIVLWFTVAVLGLALLQSRTGWEVPTVVGEESHLWLNAVFYTPNDLALFLGGALCLALASNASWLFKLTALALVCMLNVRNDAKAVLIATAIMVTVLVALRVCAALRLRPWAGFTLLALPVVAVVGGLAGVEFELADASFTPAELIADPLTRLMALEPYELAGSVFDRTDALIYAVQAFQSTWYLGLGPGGTVHTLALPQFEIATTKSLHNALAEVALEFGPVALLGFCLMLPPLVRALVARRPDATERGRLMLAAAAPMLAVSQSSGFISNYAFWLTAFLICWPAVAGDRRVKRRPAEPATHASPPGAVTVAP
jgi:hypothetical protein